MSDWLRAFPENIWWIRTVSTSLIGSVVRLPSLPSGKIEKYLTSLTHGTKNPLSFRQNLKTAMENK